MPSLLKLSSWFQKYKQRKEITATEIATTAHATYTGITNWQSEEKLCLRTNFFAFAVPFTPQNVYCAACRSYNAQRINGWNGPKDKGMANTHSQKQNPCGCEWSAQQRPNKSNPIDIGKTRILSHTIDDVMPLLYWIIIRFPTFSRRLHSIFSQFLSPLAARRALRIVARRFCVAPQFSIRLDSIKIAQPIQYYFIALLAYQFFRYRSQINWHFSKLTQSQGASESAQKVDRVAMQDILLKSKTISTELMA